MIVDETQKKQLEDLVQQLQVALASAPPDKVGEARAVASQAKLLVDEAVKDKPDKGVLRIFFASLRGAAQFLIESVPPVVDVAGKIVTLIAAIHGI